MPGPFVTTTIAGIPFQRTSLEQAVAWLIDTAQQERTRGVAVRLANAYCVALASQSPTYGALMRSRGINFPDGAPVVAAMRALGPTEVAASRVRGPSFFRAVLSGGVDSGLRHFFVGTTPTTLRSLEKAASAAYPGLRIAGHYAPPFGEVDETFLSELSARAHTWNADVVWVGMGTPKQDFVAQMLADRNGIIAVGVGAGFDYIAGTVREAPSLMRRTGFEWMYRLAVEPRRLWSRYAFTAHRFSYLAAAQLVRSERACALPVRLIAGVMVLLGDVARGKRH